MGGGYDRSRSLGFLASDCKEHFKVRAVMVRLHVEARMVAAGTNSRAAGLRLSLELAFMLLVWPFGDCIRFGGGCILSGWQIPLEWDMLARLTAEKAAYIHHS